MIQRKGFTRLLGCIYETLVTIDLLSTINQHAYAVGDAEAGIRDGIPVLVENVNFMKTSSKTS